MSSQHAQEIAQGERFGFGANWQRFLTTLNNERIDEAKKSLAQMLQVDDLAGKNFLDIGCGSGLFSLAAYQLGATVYSFDYDPQSVACALELRRRFANDDSAWQIEEGSALDEAYIRNLGMFDVVYSWGVLHHTGDMMTGLRNAQLPVKEGGILFIALYNDQDFMSKLWTRVKKMYVSGAAGRTLVQAVFIPYFALQSVAVGVLKYRNPLANFANYKRKRGMSIYYDWLDWLGGYPFEVARPEAVFHFYKAAGFEMVNLVTTNRLGCNEFVFRKVGSG